MLRRDDGANLRHQRKEREGSRWTKKKMLPAFPAITRERCVMRVSKAKQEGTPDKGFVHSFEQDISPSLSPLSWGMRRENHPRIGLCDEYLNVLATEHRTGAASAFNNGNKQQPTGANQERTNLIKPQNSGETREFQSTGFRAASSGAGLSLCYLHFYVCDPPDPSLTISPARSLTSGSRSSAQFAPHIPSSPNIASIVPSTAVPSAYPFLFCQRPRSLSRQFFSVLNQRSRLLPSLTNRFCSDKPVQPLACCAIRYKYPAECNLRGSKLPHCFLLVVPSHVYKCDSPDTAGRITDNASNERLDDPYFFLRDSVDRVTPRKEPVPHGNVRKIKKK